MVFDPDVSNTVKDALVTTGKLWTRATGADAAWTVHNAKHSSLSDKVVKALTQKSETRKSKKAKKKQRKIYQEKAYTTWTQVKEDEWLLKIRDLEHAPTEEQMAFLTCVIDRCKQERNELASFSVKGMTSKFKKRRRHVRNSLNH